MFFPDNAFFSFSFILIIYSFKKKGKGKGKKKMIKKVGTILNNIVAVPLVITLSFVMAGILIPAVTIAAVVCNGKKPDDVTPLKF